MENITFKKLTKKRKIILQQHCEEDLFYELKNGDVLVSIPHAVNQTRLGKVKYAEPGSVNLGLALKEMLNSSFIIKTKNNFDDANFDEKSKYKDKIKYMISSKGIKYVVDCHSLRKNRECDVNLGIRFGENIKTNIALYEELKHKLEEAGFVVTVDYPFYSNPNTIASYVAANFDVWSIQLEVNSKITNESSNFKKFKRLLEILTSSFKGLQ